MTQRGAAVLGAVLSLVAILCVLLSLVIQLGESIRYQQQGLAIGSVPYQMSELALIMGAPALALITVLAACVLSPHWAPVTLAIPVAAISVYHLYLAISRL